VDLGLESTVCLITGSTGGIGLESARLLAAEGATVVTSGRRNEPPGVGEKLHVAADLVGDCALRDGTDKAASRSSLMERRMTMEMTRCGF